MSLAPDLDVLPTGQAIADTHSSPAGGDLSAADDHPDFVTHEGNVVGSDSPGQNINAPHCRSAGTPDGAKAVAEPSAHTLRPEDALLAIYADAVDDLERVRIATENRLRALGQAKGMDDTPEAERMQALVDALAALEHGAILELNRAMRKHPLGAWVKQATGVGEKSAARFLAAVGPLEHRQNPGQVWSYCGLVPGKKRQKGVKSNWNSKAKSRAWLMANKCVITGVRKTDDADDSDGYDLANRYAISKYGQLYLDRRGWTAETHPEWSDGHANNDALRYVAKRVLRDMWREAKEVTR